MALRSICLYLYQKCMSATDIHKDTEATLRLYAIGYAPVTKHLRETQVTHDSERGRRNKRSMTSGRSGIERI
jgi:hypothetical protein